MSGPLRKSHKPTKEMRHRVLNLAAVGMTLRGIAADMGFSYETLKKYYRAEIDDGREVDRLQSLSRTKELQQQDTDKSTALRAAMFRLNTMHGHAEKTVVEANVTRGEHEALRAAALESANQKIDEIMSRPLELDQMAETIRHAIRTGHFVGDAEQFVFLGAMPPKATEIH